MNPRFALALLIAVIPLARADQAFTPTPDECRLAVTGLVQNQQNLYDVERKKFEVNTQRQYDEDRQRLKIWENKRSKILESAQYVVSRFNGLLDELQEARVQIVAKTRTYNPEEWAELIDARLELRRSENYSICKPDKDGSIPQPVEAQVALHAYLQTKLTDGLYRNHKYSFTYCGNDCGRVGDPREQSFYVDLRTDTGDSSCATGFERHRYLRHTKDTMERFLASSYRLAPYPLNTLSPAVLIHYRNCEINLETSEHCKDFLPIQGRYNFNTETIWHEQHDLVRACDQNVCFARDIGKLQTMPKITVEDVVAQNFTEPMPGIAPQMNAPDHDVVGEVCTILKEQESPCIDYYEDINGKPYCSAAHGAPVIAQTDTNQKDSQVVRPNGNKILVVTDKRAR